MMLQRLRARGAAAAWSAGRGRRLESTRAAAAEGLFQLPGLRRPQDFHQLTHDTKTQCQAFKHKVWAHACACHGFSTDHVSSTDHIVNAWRGDSATDILLYRLLLCMLAPYHELPRANAVDSLTVNGVSPSALGRNLQFRLLCH